MFFVALWTTGKSMFRREDNQERIKGKTLEQKEAWKDWKM
jgi:hypothetical protein